MARNTNLDQAMEAEMEGVEDSDDSEDEMEGEEGPSAETLARIEALQKEVAAQPFLYSSHEELVTLLKGTEELERLRAAREAFSKAYPLTGQMWLDWARDEQRIATTPEEKQGVVDLLKRGAGDYLCVDLHLELCLASLAALASPEGRAEARRVHEEALVACGLHAAKGGLVWDSYREVEAALLALAGEEAREEQRARLAKVFARQLRQPLLGMEGTWREWVEWREAEDKAVEVDYKKARQRLGKREGLEVLVEQQEGEERLGKWREYITLEKEEGDPARVQCVYERAIADHCLNQGLWEEYLAYLESTLKMGSVVLPVYTRAIRNCPWEVELWCGHLRALERYQATEEEVTNILEQGLSAGFSPPASYLELWLTYIDYTRRRVEWESGGTNPSMEKLRSVFERARLHLGEVGGDPAMQVARYQGNLEADQYGRMETARQIWAVTLQACPASAALWLEYIALERTFGDKKHLRKAHQRAVEKVAEGAELVTASFLQFEREEGSLEAWEAARKVCRAKLARAEARQEKEKARGAGEEDRRVDKVEKKKEKDKQYRRDKRQEEAAAKKQGNGHTNGAGGFKRPESIFTMAKPGTKVVEPPPGFKPPAGFEASRKRTIEPPPGFKEPAAKRAKTVSDEEFEGLSETKQRELRTVFLSNLGYEVTDQDIRATMAASGPVLEVRLVKTPAGKSKGFAFVEFDSRGAAEGAIARDNELLQERPMYVSECGQNKKEGSSFKFKTELEKNKLFIRGLDPSVTQEDVRELFAKYGELAGVRLVTYRNGHSKGIAFVEYSKEGEAAAALVKTDGTNLKGGQLQVALSNPPSKAGDPPKAPEAPVRSLGGSQGDLADRARGKGRSMLAFTPRVLATPAKGQAAAKLAPMKFVKPGGAAKEAKEAKEGEKEGEESNEGKEETAPGGAAKSNSDFRSMFLK